MARRRQPTATDLVDGVRLPRGLPRRPIAAIRRDPRNPRQHSPAQLDALAASIQTFGFLVPVVLDADGQLVAGHARLEAAERLGLSVVPWVDASHLSDAERRAYLVADNQLTLAASWDEAQLATILAELDASAKELLPTLGFTPTELAELLASVAPAAPAGEFPAYDETVATAYQCPSCGFEWSGSPKPKTPTAAAS